MGNKNSSTHLTNQQYKSNNHSLHSSIENSSLYRTNNWKKYGLSPRFRRRHPRQVHHDKKGKKPQV